MTFNSAHFKLNSTMIKKFYTHGGKFVYAIDGLRLESDGAKNPCTSGTSRWKRTTGPCAAESTFADAATKALILATLNASTDVHNEFLRDINIKSYRSLHGGTCTSTYSEPVMGSQLTFDSACWENVHHELYNVYDMSDWVLYHQGNPDASKAGRPNPIAKWAEEGSAFLPFPSWHNMNRWMTQHTKICCNFVGRMGDMVDFKQLSTEVQSLEYAKLVGAAGEYAANGFEACGSPGEVVNDPTKGHRYGTYLGDEYTRDQQGTNGLLKQYTWNNGKIMVWTGIAINAADQLRQRVCWALSQIFVIGEDGSSRADANEAWQIYYDIFVRNAFGNYRDIMKEVSYSPLMGDYLTYLQNKALGGYSGGTAFPDENFAREVMQLFSIGLYKLNADGTREKDEWGKDIQTYGNEAIMNFARVWTGFNIQSTRKNIEQSKGRDTYNYADPMKIKPLHRDIFPKPDLDWNFLGDKYPLCIELQGSAFKPFFRKGAHYRYTGKTSTEQSRCESDSTCVRLEPNATTSGLYKLLCDRASPVDPCAFPGDVYLPEHVVCDPGMVECMVDDVTVVKLVDGAYTVFYEYVREPCVYLSFHNGGIRQKRWPGTTGTTCQDPKTPSGVPGCCNQAVCATGVGSSNNKCVASRRRDRDTSLDYTKYANEIDYELTTYETNKARCEAIGKRVCPWYNKSPWKLGYSDKWWPEHVWTSYPCKIQTQIDDRGAVSIIHTETTQSMFQINAFERSGNSFQVKWTGSTSTNGGIFPRASSNCATGCSIPDVEGGPGNTCLCDMEVKDTAIFDTSTGYGPSSQIPTRLEIEQECFIGSVDPTTIPESVSKCTSAACTSSYEVEVWFGNTADFNEFAMDTIFKIRSFGGNGPTRYFLNRRSMVHIGNDFSFRNPPHFMAFWTPKEQPSFKFAAEAEVEALLDHLFYHQNTKAFVAYRLIQRLVTSNPSPRYINAVSEAFRTGKYEGTTYSGKYGDLAATVAAVLLDRESRSDILDLDPTHGRMREPVLKILHVMRSLEYKSKDDGEIELDGLNTKIGQNYALSPSVFNFYLPEYQPDGDILNADLVSPEAELSTPPYTLGFLNGIAALIRHGLTRCTNHYTLGGFGTLLGGESRHKNACKMQNRRRRVAGSCFRLRTLANGCKDYRVEYKEEMEAAGMIHGELVWSPKEGSTTAQIVDELSLLLTQGRLNAAAAAKIVQEFDNTVTLTGRTEEGIKVAQQMMAMTAEFHTTPENILKNSTRPQPTTRASGGRPYKAVIVVFLNGGIDSFNLLVPHSQCTANGGKDMYNEYSTVRTNVAIPKIDLLEIDEHTGKQPCAKFGVHPSLTEVRDQYQDGKAAWLANIGQLVTPMTKAQYLDGSVKTPPSPFAHNSARQNGHSCHAQMKTAKGVAGRMMKALEEATIPYNTGLYSLNGNAKILTGGKDMPDVIAGKGVIQYSGGDYGGIKEETVKEMLTQHHSTSVFSNTYVTQLESGLHRTKVLGDELAKTTNDPVTTFPTNKLGDQLKQVAKLIKANGVLKHERGAFFTEIGGFDTHKDLGSTLERELPKINAALKAFREEMEAQGEWNNVAIVTMSDFGRTLTSNGRGTDHAWGGNMFMMGGKVKGKKIHGEFPDDLTDKGSRNIGRGRLIPTRGWESVWNGIAEWMGVDGNKMDTVLPNRKNYPTDQLFTATDLFNT